MLETEDKEIDGYEFRYQPMMLKQSRRQFDQLAQRFGPAIASAVEGLGDAEIAADMEYLDMLGGLTDSAGALLRGFVGGLDPAYHEQLANALAEKTMYKNAEGNFVPLDNNTREVMFGKNLLTEAKLIWWCLSIQYADFLAPLGNLGVQAALLKARAASASGSRKASTGSPIGSPHPTDTATA